MLTYWHFLRSDSGSLFKDKCSPSLCMFTCWHDESKYRGSIDDGFLLISHTRFTQSEHTQSWLNWLRSAVLDPKTQSFLSQINQLRAQGLMNLLYFSFYWSSSMLSLMLEFCHKDYVYEVKSPSDLDITVFFRYLNAF